MPNTKKEIPIKRKLLRKKGEHDKGDYRHEIRIRGVDPEVKAEFKARCARMRQSMEARIAYLIEKDLENEGSLDLD